MDDAGFLSEAVGLARKALEDDDGGPFGAVVVKDGRVVGRGRNLVLAGCDPTAHAEVMAIRDACRHLGTHVLAGCTVYTSAEPCPMCLGALYWARVDRIVYGVDRHAAAAAGFDDAFFYEEMCRRLEDRHVAMDHVPREDARTVMEAWKKRPGRIDY